MAMTPTFGYSVVGRSLEIIRLMTKISRKGATRFTSMECFTNNLFILRVKNSESVKSQCSVHRGNKVLLFQFMSHFRQHCDLGCVQLYLFASVGFVPANSLQQVFEDDHKMWHSVHEEHVPMVQ